MAQVRVVDVVSAPAYKSCRSYDHHFKVFLKDFLMSSLSDNLPCCRYNIIMEPPSYFLPFFFSFIRLYIPISGYFDTEHLYNRPLPLFHPSFFLKRGLQLVMTSKITVDSDLKDELKSTYLGEVSL